MAPSREDTVEEERWEIREARVGKKKGDRSHWTYLQFVLGQAADPLRLLDVHVLEKPVTTEGNCDDADADVKQRGGNLRHHGRGRLREQEESRWHISLPAASDAAREIRRAHA